MNADQRRSEVSGNMSLHVTLRRECRGESNGPKNAEVRGISTDENGSDILHI